MLRQMDAPKNKKDLLLRQMRISRISKNKGIYSKYKLKIEVLQFNNKRKTDKILKIIEKTLKRQKKLIINNGLSSIQLSDDRSNYIFSII